MKKIFLIVLSVLFATTLFAKPFLYITHNDFPNISVYDTATNKVVGSIKTRANVSALELSPNSKYLYFVSPETNALYKSYTKNFRVSRDYINVGTEPKCLVHMNNKNVMYVGNHGSQSVSVINLQKMEPIIDPIRIGGGPNCIAISPNDKRVYVGLDGQDGVAVISTSSNKRIGVIRTGFHPWDMVIDGNRLFISNEAMGSISVVDLRTSKVIREIITHDQPRGLAVFNNMLYTSVSGGLDIFELKRYTKPASAGFGYSVYDAIYGKTSTGKKIYIAGYDEETATGKIAVIDPDINEVVSETDVKGWPQKLAIVQTRPTPVPTATPRNTATPVPTVTPKPTIKPTLKPTPKPTKKPTRKPKPKPRPTKKPSLTGVVKGSVVYGPIGRRPVGNIKVIARSKHKSKQYKTKTNGNGRFSFRLPIGAYYISPEATYLQEKSVAYTVNRSGNKSLKIKVYKRR